MEQKEPEPLLTFKNRNYAPPGGTWFYTVPETGQQFDTRVSMDTLLGEVTHHYVLNKIPVPSDLRTRIEDHICRKLGGSFCDGPVDPSTAPLDFFTVLQLSELLFRRAIARDFFVAQPHADERARTCVACPKNVKHMCTGCNGLREMFRRMVSNRKSLYDTALGVCEVCGCGLAAKVHVNRKYLVDNPRRRQTYPDGCWLVKETKG